MFKRLTIAGLALLAWCVQAAVAAPVVSITAPATNSKFTPPTSLTLTANASDSASTISKVEFYNGATLIGTATTLPYTVTWNNVAAGSYTLTAVATSAANISTSSAGVAVVVNTAPVVTLTAPTSGMSVVGRATITLSADASDADNNLAKVEFFNGTSLIGTKTSAPYTLSWNNVNPGSYTVTAKATDSLGSVATSAGASISVTNPVSVALNLSSTLFTPPATIIIGADASSANSSITQVNFYNGSTLLGSSTTAPYSFTWSGVPTGKYLLSASATDAQGITQNSWVRSVVVDTPPSVSLSAPANGSSFIGPASISIAANATDTDNDIAKVEFLNGSTVIGTATSAPYIFSWTNVQPGTYKISARVTDSYNYVVTSAAANVTVVNPVSVSITAPTSYKLFAPPGTVTLTANASTNASGASIAKVEFYNGATLLGPGTGTPFTYTWNGIATGKYLITAKATDSNGMVNTSSNVVVLVDMSPTITLNSPVYTGTYTTTSPMPIAVTVADADGSVAKVDFYDGATLLQTLTAEPYTYQWPNPTAGSHTIKAVVTDDLGAVNAAARTVSVINNQKPTVSVSANPAKAASPATIALTAAAADSDGSITQVEFFYNGTSLGIVNTAPYAYTWNNVAQGNYTVTAKATDNLGAVTTSDSVPVTVSGAAAQAYYIYADHLNTPRQVVDQSNHVVWQWDQSDPFGGNPPVASNGVEFNLRFPGQYYDKETNLHYNYFRDYDSQTGRYVQSDPIGLRGGVATYSYVAANPTGFVDPNGLDWSTAIGMTFDWMSGTGADNRHFGPETSSTKEMMNARRVKEAREYFYKKNAQNLKNKNCNSLVAVTGYKGDFGLTDLFWYAGLNPTQQFVGSYRIDIYPVDGNQIKFVLSNNSSMKSFLYGVGPAWERSTFGLFGNMRQTYTWTEKLR